jgi:hypothetical protein
LHRANSLDSQEQLLRIPTKQADQQRIQGQLKFYVRKMIDATARSPQLQDRWASVSSPVQATDEPASSFLVVASSRYQQQPRSSPMSVTVGNRAPAITPNCIRRAPSQSVTGINHSVTAANYRVNWTFNKGPGESGPLRGCCLWLLQDSMPCVHYEIMWVNWKWMLYFLSANKLTV